MFDPNPFSPVFEAHAVGVPASSVALESVFDELIALLAERNNDFYEVLGGDLVTRR